ncbi:MAG TPA: type II toxin-antitoxin system VapC family toxin [Dehalococcoidia bacterium]|nr:type II toxin-antitoxin system VapC family toxin [Dehalococcoidia bacterium]
MPTGSLRRRPGGRGRRGRSCGLASRAIAVSVITAAEIHEAAFSSSNPDARIAGLRAFLQPFQLLGVNEPIAIRFAEIRAYLRRRRQIISDFDILLGATALHHDLTVLTFNRRHFERIPDLRLYHADDGQV